MMAGQNSLYSDDWRRVARQDWHRIHVMLADGDADGVELFLQQALEKYLKAYLLQRGWHLKKIHTLQSLLDEAAAHDGGLRSLRGVCEQVSGFYIAERYPSLGGSEVETADVRRFLPDARDLSGRLFADEVLE